MSVSAFAAASRFYCRIVAEAGARGWDRRGLGDWTLLELIAHGNRAHTTVVEYLTNPVEPANADYFADDAIAARARRAVADLGDDPAAGVAASSEAAIAAITSAAPDATVGTPLGTLALVDYLPSRIAELLIHGLDVARAADIAYVDPPGEAVVTCLHFLTDRAVREGLGLELVLALSGRQSLPGEFSVY